MRIAVAQIDIAWESVSDNLETLTQQTHRAKQQGADLCLFPEMALCGYSMRSTQMAQACAGVPQALQDLARRHQIWVGAGYVEASDDPARPYNTLGLAGPNGQWDRYHKLHPFSLAKEADHFSAGSTPVRVEVAGLRCALWVCYDLRFANAFWSTAHNVDVHLVIANWPAKRRHAWRTLLQARAIENQAYVVGCNRVGEASGLVYSGDSCVIDPLGKTLIRAQHQPALLMAELCAERVAKIRRKFPVLRDRRNEL